jgi:hypothetical protein
MKSLYKGGDITYMEDIFERTKQRRTVRRKKGAKYIKVTCETAKNTMNAGLKALEWINPCILFH